MKEESRFISILSDYGFKAVFANEADTLFLRKALQALIQSNVPIKKIQFVKNSFIGLTEESRAGVYDMICEDENQKTFIVEMQLGPYRHFIHRAKFYAFQKFNTLVEKGKYLFDNLPPIFCIGFLAKGLYPNSKEYYHFGTLKNQVGEVMDNQITYIIVEINKFEKKDNQVQSNLDKLIYIMKNLETITGADQLPKFITEDWIDQAMKKLDKSKMTPDQRMHYEMMMARNAAIAQQHKKMTEKAKKEGMEKGIEKGMEKGIKVGEKKGEKKGERKKAVEAAKKLKAFGVEIKIIAEATGLSAKEIEAL